MDALVSKGALRQREEVLASLRERIVRFATSRYTREFAEDLAQETMLVLHERYSHLESVEDLLPVALQTMRYQIANLRRKHARRGENTHVSTDGALLADPGPGPAEEAERRELLDRMKQALGRLGGRCRQLMRLKLEGRSFEEIREALDARSLNTVYTWDHRCRKQLLELMGAPAKKPEQQS